MRLGFFAAISATLSILCFPNVTRAETRTFGPFSVDLERPDTIHLSGAISDGAALDFRRALHAAPNPKLLILDSNGGNVQQALLIADDVFVRKIATLPLAPTSFSRAPIVRSRASSVSTRSRPELVR
jgi:hypothetical protein